MNNLLKRSIFGAVYVAVIVASLTVLPQALPFLCAAAMVLMLHEFWHVSIGKGKLLPTRIVATVSAVFSFAVLYLIAAEVISLNWYWLEFLVLAVPIATFPALQVFNRDRFSLEGLGYIYYGLFWIAIPFVTIPLLVFNNNNFDGSVVLSSFIIIWCSDVGAYLLGSALGQRPKAWKLAPEISPKKSWWGVVGAVILSCAVALVLVAAGLLSIPVIHALVLAVLICFSGIVGDLFESLWKRHFNIKDSGNTIPGHGGFLDRLDSSLAAFPVIYIYLTVFNLI